MNNSLRKKIYTIIFESDTRAGKNFDLLLIMVIVFSIVVVFMESTPRIRMEHGHILRVLEWVVTILFTIEYVFRIYSIKKPLKYIFSFFGIIDLLALMPTYMSIFITGAASLIIIRALRLLRIFRILKLSRYTSEGAIIIKALKASRVKIGVFLFGVLTVVIIIGTLMYLVEGEKNGFVSIPTGMYWTIVTITTVGYGDIAPQTALGQFIAAMTMILGYAIIAVPTGIVTVEFNKVKEKIRTVSSPCPSCDLQHHDVDAKFCKQCGEIL